MRQLNPQSTVSSSQVRMETWLYPLLLLFLLALYTGIPEYRLSQEVFPRVETLKTLTGQLKVTPRRNLDKVAVVTKTGDEISFYCRPWLLDSCCIPDDVRKTGASIEIVVRDVSSSTRKNVEAFGVKVNEQQITSYAQTKESLRKSENANLFWLAENACLFIAYLLTVDIKSKGKLTKNSLIKIFVIYSVMYAILFHIHLNIVN